MTALCLGRPIICESGHAENNWMDVVPFAKDENDFYHRVMIARTMWRAMHAMQFDKFKQKFAPETCVGKALATIGIENALQKAQAA